MRRIVTPAAPGDRTADARVLCCVAPSDGDLVVRARGGDLEAFATLIARHRDRLLRYARNMLGSPEDGEEAVQDALVRAHRSLASADPERFGAWVYRIVVNRCRSVARRRRWWTRVAATLDDAGQLADRDPAPDLAWREEIDRALAALPAEQREAFLLKHVDELSYEEMSTLVGASVPALKMRVFRACERLRRALEPAT